MKKIIWSPLMTTWTLVFGVAVGVSEMAQAVYKCVKPSGTVYQAQPCTSGNETVITVDPAPRTTAGTLEKWRRESDELMAKEEQRKAAIARLGPEPKLGTPEREMWSARRSCISTRYIYEARGQPSESMDECVARSRAESEAAKKRKAEQEAEATARQAVGPPQIGMTASKARESSWGAPDVNRTTTAGGVREQWVYRMGNSTRYVYVDNGVVTAIQE